MKTFLLEPVLTSFGHADWTSSATRAPATFEAEDETWARILATAAFLVLRADGAARPRSPWMQPELVRAIELSAAGALPLAAAA